LCEAPPRDDKVRERLYEEERARPGVLHLKLRAVDPESAARIASADLVRVVRALEVHEVSGVSMSEHQKRGRAGGMRLQMRVALLDPPRATVDRRIERRTRQMIEQGLVDETRLLYRRYGAEAPPLGAVGYRQALQHLDGAIKSSDLLDEIARATRQYARRQRTWFKKEPEIVRYEDAAALLDHELAWLRSVV
jgi:tRNA dimethylallyltransferase